MALQSKRVNTQAYLSLLAAYKDTLKIVFFSDSIVSAVLELSRIIYTLKFSVQRFLALTEKSKFSKHLLP